MAKQAKAKQVEVAPQEVVTQVATPVKPTKPTWEIKDRVYYLKGRQKPFNINNTRQAYKKTCFTLF